MKKILKYILLIGLVLLFVWTMWFLYQKSASRPDEFNIEKPKISNVIKKTVANGKVVPRKEVLIKPVVSGIISEMYVEAGQQVKKDQPLAKIR
ncbi:MAG TPA: biotin/lipoyl-binding protein, partial [Flavobacteriales bacterium]|nr:biotin/lipoyl-binding protein [Flavobacteriales bacterium]